jgi:hypothetical protein
MFINIYVSSNPVIDKLKKINENNFLEIKRKMKELLWSQ